MVEKNSPLKTHLFIFGFLGVLFWMGFLTNVAMLQYQCDPFISTTIAMGTYIQDSGSTSYFGHTFDDTTLGFWEGLSVDSINYIPGSGVLVSMGSLITGLSVETFAYLPGPYLILYFILCIFIVQASDYINGNFSSLNLPWRIGLSFITLTSALSFIGFYCIGKWYLFEYHALYLVYSLLILYLLISIILRNDFLYYRKIIFPLLLLYAITLFTHYQFPYTVIFGVLTFISVLVIIKYVCSIPYGQTIRWFLPILLLFFLLISFQQFYYIVTQIPVTDLLNMMIQRINLVGESSNLSSPIYPKMPYLLQFKKIWHVLIACIVVCVFISTIIYLKTHVFKKDLAAHFIYIILLGINFAWMISYFSHYGLSFGIELKDVWMLNLFLIIPILLFTRSNSKPWKWFASFLGLIFVISNVALCGWLMLDVSSSIEGYSSFPYQIKESINGLDTFLIHNVDDKKPTRVVGSIQATSAFYESIMVSHKEMTKQFIVDPTIMVMPNLDKASFIEHDFYESLNRNGVSIFILTAYETQYGYYGGLSSKPISPAETKKLDTVLERKCNTIYNSGKAKLFDL